ncbi:MAG: flagellar biosynthetic protein FliO [Firmicutes bacterium]|nr:flagellar biosynthetic protein FliO [Bacillota bacterium]
MEAALAVIRLLVSLGLVLALCYFILRVLVPRLQLVRPGWTTQMRLVERLPVGVRSYLCLVQVGERVFLLGVSPANISLLAEVTAGSIALPPVSAGATDSPLPTHFAEVLRQSKDQATRSFRELRKKCGRSERSDGEKRGQDHE